MIEDRYDLAFKLYPYQRSVDQDTVPPARHPVVVVGGGLVGMAMALDLGLQNIPVVVLDDHEGIATGSRAICFSKRSLEIADRYGCGEAMLAKGVIWNLGKVFYDDKKIFEFNLLPQEGHKFPAFINLQQPHFEKFLIERIYQAQAADAPIELRGKNRVDGIDVKDDHVALTITTPEGPYRMQSDWLIACDGAASPLRKMLHLDFEGQVFKDNFLIADVKMKANFPTERWFWFEPHFKSGDSALLHKQPDDIWRIDFQIGWDIDRNEELKEKNICKRLDAMLGPDSDYDLVWTSIYTFQCRRMTTFRHKRVIFAGDAAHQVSPFGARGANSGMQDVDNLGWKLGLVINGKAPEKLLDTYNAERVYAADENIRNSTRSTNFITPKSNTSRIFRNAVLELAEHYEFARSFVNSGRLSLPCIYDGSALNGLDKLPGGPKATRVGSPCPDALVQNGYLLNLLGNDFVILAIGTDVPDIDQESDIKVKRVSISPADDISGLIAKRYLGDASQAIYLIRPDQHVVARWKNVTESSVRAALRKACLLDTA